MIKLNLNYVHNGIGYKSKINFTNDDEKKKNYLN